MHKTHKFVLRKQVGFAAVLWRLRQCVSCYILLMALLIFHYMCKFICWFPEISLGWQTISLQKDAIVRWTNRPPLFRTYSNFFQANKKIRNILNAFQMHHWYLGTSLPKQMTTTKRMSSWFNVLADLYIFKYFVLV